MKAFIGILLLSMHGISNAGVVEIKSTTMNWKLENYPNGYIVIWNTGANCIGAGALKFSNSASELDKKNLWATILTAKAIKRAIFIRYETSDCSIVSFGPDY